MSISLTVNFLDLPVTDYNQYTTRIHVMVMDEGTIIDVMYGSVAAIEGRIDDFGLGEVLHEHIRKKLKQDTKYFKKLHEDYGHYTP